MPKGVYRRKPETIQKLIDRNKSYTGRKWPESQKIAFKAKRKLQKPRSGFKQTDEIKKRISEGVKRRYATDPTLRKRQSESHRKSDSGKARKLMYLIRNCYKYRLWRSDVYTRDNFTCVHCLDSKGGNLHPDHIEPLSFIIRHYDIRTIEQAHDSEAIWDINNGRTLCESCHKETDTWGTKALKYKR